jgi:hypothetical protein
MNVQKLNERQVKWIMQLLIWNFIIVYKSEKINSINASLKWFNYKVENIFANHLLLTLQQKLTRIKSLNNFIFIVIREIYCIYVKNEIEKIFIHNVNEDVNKHSAMHVRNMLLKTMIIMMQKTYLNKVYFSKNLRS